MQRGESWSWAAMAGLCLFLTLVGPTGALLVTVSESSINTSAGNTALLSASLSFSPSVRNYFQLRWRFVTGNLLVLKMKASNCSVQTGTRPWRDSCGISIEVADRYRQRAKLSSKDASLELQDVRTEDSGIYSVSVLALDMATSANINLTVTKAKVDPDIPVSFVKAAEERDYTMSNSIQLGLAVLILFLLGLIIAEHISFTYCKHRKTTAWDKRETKWCQAGMECTVPPVPGSEELYCTQDC